MLHNRDSVILKRNYRGKKILVGANGILVEEAIDKNIDLSGFKFVQKENGIYIWCINMDFSRRKVEIIGSKGFREIDCNRYL